MPYRTSSPRVAGRRRGGRPALGCASELVDISPMVDGYFAVADAGDAAARSGAGNFMARQRMAVLYDRSVHVGRARRRDRQQDRVADRLHDAVRRQRVRLQPDRRPVQEPGPPARRRRSACPTRSSARRRRPTCGRARPTRPRPGSAIPVLDRLLFWRIDKRRSDEEMAALGLRSGAGRAGRPDDRDLRVQAPGPADRQARAADGRASTTCTRGGGPAPRAVPSGRRDGPAAAIGCSSSPRRSGTWPTSRSARSRCSAPCR